MLLIGMLHHRKSPLKVKKAYAYSIVAKAEGAELLYFSPKTIDFNRRIINGYQYKNGKWNSVESRFPDVIYNAGSPDKLNKSYDIIKQLRKEIPFTTHSIGNKLSVYKRLKADGEFASYLIPTHTIDSIDDFKRYLKMYEKLVFKPVDGHKGQGILFIETIKDTYHILSKEQDIYYNEEELIDDIKNKLKTGDYLVQLYINSVTNEGNAFDFRLHLQKNGKGKWVLTTIYPRIASKGTIVANINNGGSTLYLEPFLQQQFSDNAINVKNYLMQFSYKIAAKMDELQEKYFHQTIDEIGVDIGLDRHNKIWIYEVNWRPGCPPAFYLELDVVKNMIHYAMFLAKHKVE